jgi:hypothetical protein
MHKIHEGKEGIYVCVNFFGCVLQILSETLTMFYGLLFCLKSLYSFFSLSVLKCSFGMYFVNVFYVDTHV